MSSIPALTSFTANTQAKAAEVNSNFSAIRTAVNTYCPFVDDTATITGVWTFSTSPVFSAAVTMALGLTITASGITVTAGGVTITAGGLTVTAGGITVDAGASTFAAAVSITGTCTATTFSGSGASLTDLPATSLTGTINNARMPTAVSVTTLASSSTTTSGGGFVQTGGKSYTNITTSSGSGTVTIDASLTNWHKHTMTGNVTTFTISNMSAGQKLCLELVNQSTYTFAWGSVQNPSGMTVAPTANKTNYYEIVYGGNTQTITLASLNIGSAL